MDKKIFSMKDIFLLLEKIMKEGKLFLIIVEDIEGEVLMILVVNKLRGVLNIVVVKVLGFGDRRKEMFKDIVILIGG